MREERVDAGDGPLRILSIDFVFGLAIFLGDGENSQGGEGFERIGRLRMQHAEANVKIVAGIHKDQASGGSQNKKFKNDSDGNHINVVTLPQTEENGDAADVRESHEEPVRYNANSTANGIGEQGNPRGQLIEGDT